MAHLTLVPDSLARPGFRFTFQGANAGKECEGCPYQRICFALDPGHAYQVTSTREVTHPCGLHEDGKVRVVLVDEVPFPTSLETPHLRGTAAPWVPVPCGRPECPSYSLCHPVGPARGARHEIVEDLGAMGCPAGFDLHRVRLRRMPE